MDWCDVIPNEYLAKSFNNYFFPKWLNILHYWLNQDPNFEEVAIWYKGWKSLIPQSFLAFEPIKKNLTIALSMMNCASQDENIFNDTQEFIKNFEKIYEEEILNKELKPTSTKGLIRASNYSTMNFKDVVEHYASQKGILFQPIFNNLNLMDGKTYYKFGNATIYIDRSVIFVNNKKSQIWSPISLQDLVDQNLL